MLHAAWPAGTPCSSEYRCTMHVPPWRWTCDSLPVCTIGLKLTRRMVALVALYVTCNSRAVQPGQCCLTAVMHPSEMADRNSTVHEDTSQLSSRSPKQCAALHPSECAVRKTSGKDAKAKRSPAPAESSLAYYISSPLPIQLPL